MLCDFVSLNFSIIRVCNALWEDIERNKDAVKLYLKTGFNAWERKCVVCVDGKVVGFCTFESIISYAKELGYEKIYIMSGEIGLYEKYGFVKSGDYETVYGSVDQLFV